MKAQLSWLVGYCLKSMEKLDIDLISPSSLWFLIGTQMVLICKMFLKNTFKDFPGGPVAKTLPS